MPCPAQHTAAKITMGKVDSGFNIMGMPAVEFDEDGGKPKIAWNGTDK